MGMTRRWPQSRAQQWVALSPIQYLSVQLSEAQLRVFISTIQRDKSLPPMSSSDENARVPERAWLDDRPSVTAIRDTHPPRWRYGPFVSDKRSQPLLFDFPNYSKWSHLFMTSSTSSTCMLTSISVKDEQEKETLGLPFVVSCIWPTHAATAWECGKSSAAAAPKLTRPRGPYVTSRNALKGENTSFPFRLYARLCLFSSAQSQDLLVKHQLSQNPLHKWKMK